MCLQMVGIDRMVSLLLYLIKLSIICLLSLLKSEILLY